VKARRLIDDAVRRLRPSPALDHGQRGRERLEAEEMLTHILGEEPDPDEEIDGDALGYFHEMVERRYAGEPIPFIKGYTEFMDLEMIAEPGVFVPRDSSEWLAEQAIRRLRRRPHPVSVDLATGGGTIALAVADRVPHVEVFGADISEEAVALARRNARRLKLKARFAVGDMFDPLPRRLSDQVDVITLHPPYVPVGEVKDLPDEIKEWEPLHTLTDKSLDGLGLVVRAAAEGPRWLAPNGWLLIEVSPDRTRDVSAVLRRAAFRDVRSTKGGDLPITRVVEARRPA
jgi:release factor glutamine methyltransferase